MKLSELAEIIKEVILLPDDISKWKAIPYILNQSSSFKSLDKTVRESIEVSFKQREGLAPTSIGNGIAVPHIKSKFVSNVTLVVGYSPNGIDWDENSKKDAHIILLFASPNDNPILHLQVLAATCILAKRGPDIASKFNKATSAEEMLEILSEYLKRLQV